MKIIIEEQDVQRAAEFIAENGDRLLVISKGGSKALVNITAARQVCADVSDEHFTVTLGGLRAVPSWLYEARSIERKRLADLSDRPSSDH